MRYTILPCILSYVPLLKSDFSYGRDSCLAFQWAFSERWRNLIHQDIHVDNNPQIRHSENKNVMQLTLSENEVEAAVQ